MRNSKLLKVMDYLINEQDDKARELLHQIFIEKARAIHESMMTDEEMDEETLGGDEGLGLGNEIEHHKEEIESEEHYGDGTMEDIDLDSAVDDLGDEDGDDMDMGDEDGDDMDMDMDDDMDDEDGEDEVTMDMDDDMDSDDSEDEDERIHDLEQAIEELKAEFDAIKSHEGSEHEADDSDEEEEVDENWMDETDDLSEDFDDLDESLDLEEISVNMKKAGEVGSGNYSRVETNTKSPVATNRAPSNGAEPVRIRSKNESGYARPTALSSAEMKGTSTNRRKKATDGTSPVSKDGSSRALLNKDRSEGFGATNTKSPLGSAGTTPKK